MPELPEVEYVARQLRAELVGRRIVRARVLWPRSVQGMDPREFEHRVTDRTVIDIGRRAKYLLVYLDDDDVLLVHRRMSGNVHFAGENEANQYVRVAFELDDGRHLLYTDPRKFGRLQVMHREALATAFAALGPEPLDASFTVDVLEDALAGKQRQIKAVLLDQSVVAGLGNIYADEALFRAGIHPQRTASSLSHREVAVLRDAIQAVLLTGIEHGGTTFGRHRDAHNEAGRNLEHVQVYRRAGQPCPRCGTPLQRIVVAQRGSHFCPTCQQAR